ncbi:MAG: glycosyltransferase family 39 protein [Planctomycetes bacterium]|nr:glycosyltransferase family 39 protein [Planctomycetota bacterium]
MSSREEFSREERSPGSVRPPWPGGLTWIALIIAALGAFLAPAWNQALWSTREGRVASCAQGMLESGDWLVPRISTRSEPRLHKPPLSYWMAAGCGILIGGGRVTERAAKLPSALAAVGTVLLIFALGTRAFRSRQAGMFAALALISTALFWDESSAAAADMPMVFFMVLAVFGFWRVIEEGRRSPLDRMLPWLSLGLGFLTKGPVALTVPLVAVLGYLILDGRLRALREVIPTPLGVAAFVLVALPWYLLVLQRHPEVLGTWLGESLGRFDDEWTAHQEPFHYYLRRTFCAALLPWVLLLPAMIAHAASATARKSLPAGLKLATAWVVLGLVLFSCSSSKRQYYLLPLTPGFALAVGWILAASASARLGRLGELLVRVPLLLVALAWLASPVVGLMLPGILAKHAPDGGPAGVEFGLAELLGAAIVGVALTTLALLPAARRVPVCASVLVACVAALVWGGRVVIPALNAGQSAAAFCTRVLAALPQGETVSTLESSDFPVLAYYLGRDRVIDLDRSQLAARLRREAQGYGVAERHELLRWTEGGAVCTRIVLEGSGPARSRLVLFRWHSTPASDHE